MAGLQTRFGLHVGDAVVGNIGSPDRMNYTVLGATVNLAARLEGLNKNYGTLILVSAALQQRTASRFVFRSVDRIKPEGLCRSVRDLRVGCARGEGDAAHDELARDWEVVYAALRHGPRAVAERELAAFLKKYPNDQIARYHQKFASNSSEANGGVHVG